MEVPENISYVGNLRIKDVAGDYVILELIKFSHVLHASVLDDIIHD